jgi:predicted Zn-dependent protease with MMP-like domain
MRLPREEFERLVEQALAELPDELKEKLENVEVFVEDFPRPEHLGERNVPPGLALFGLYVGHPLTTRGTGWSPLFPDRIYIYQRPIEHYCRTKREIVEQVRQTVLHEVGHFFGISDARLREIEEEHREKTGHE